MNYMIKHQAAGQLHIKLPSRRLTAEEADVLYYGLLERPEVISVQVYLRTASATIRFLKGRSADILEYLDGMDLHSPEAIEALPGVSAT